MKESWVIDIRNQCQEAKVPFFFKQWGGMNKKKTGRELEGRTWEEMPLLSHMCRRQQKARMLLTVPNLLRVPFRICLML